MQEMRAAKGTDSGNFSDTDAQKNKAEEKAEGVVISHAGLSATRAWFGISSTDGADGAS